MHTGVVRPAGPSLVLAALVAAGPWGCGVGTAAPAVPTCARGTSDGCVDHSLYYTVLFNDPSFGGICRSGVSRNSFACDVAARRFCVAHHFVTGFPTQTSDTFMRVACFNAPAVEAQVPFATLVSLNGRCKPSSIYSIYCEEAADRYCLGQGLAGGFGPTEYAGGIATIGCFPATMVARIAVSYSAVFELKDFCPGSHYRDSTCDGVSDAYCQNSGAGATGTGPQQLVGDMATLLCVHPPR